VVRSLFNPNEKLIEVILAADALRRAGARHVTLVAPYLPYMRQDKVFAPGEPISQRVVAELLGQNFDAVLTMEPHLHRVHSLSEVFPCKAVSVSAAPAIAAWVRKLGKETLVAGPDEESGRWVREIARIAATPWVVGRKHRSSDRKVAVHFDKIEPMRRAVIIDDIASSGATMASAIRALRAVGIARVEVTVVHAIFAPGAITAIRRAGAGQIVSCDTVAHPTNEIRCARLFAGAIERTQ